MQFFNKAKSVSEKVRTTSSKAPSPNDRKYSREKSYFMALKIPLGGEMDICRQEMYYEQGAIYTQEGIAYPLPHVFQSTLSQKPHCSIYVSVWNLDNSKIFPPGSPSQNLEWKGRYCVFYRKDLCEDCYVIKLRDSKPHDKKREEYVDVPDWKKEPLLLRSVLNDVRQSTWGFKSHR